MSPEVSDQDDIGGSACPEDELSTLEWHSGLVLGRRERERAPTPEPDIAPRLALERVLSELLAAHPCTVQFSGGRDSSLVLAVAAHVARRGGLPLPGVVTLRHPDVPATEESAWQNLVLEHLGLKAEVVEVSRGAMDIAGPLAVSRLERHGPLFPPTAAVRAAFLGPHVAGQTVLTGEGGDQILGASRVTALTAHVVRRRRPSGRAAVEMGRDVLPESLRRRIARRRISETAPWLRSPVRDRVLTELAGDIAAEPWDWREARWFYADSRLWDIGFNAIRRTSAAEGFRVENPLTAPSFISSLCSYAGRWGLTSRTSAMRLLAGDLLPEEVLTRSTKADFGEVYAGDAVRAFAHQWDGKGIDDRIADPLELRKAWGSTTIPFISFAPLHRAIFAHLGGSPTMLG